MRVLVSAIPGSGHIYPLLPLSRRMRALGHEVVWATSADQCAPLAEEGFATAPVCPPIGAWMAQLAARTRGLPGDGVPPHRTTHWFAPRLFGEVGAPLMIDKLLARARELRPDVVLFESRCYAAAAVARAVAALPVLQAVTMLLLPEVEAMVSDAVTPLWRELGLQTPSLAGVFDGLTLSAWPASIDDPAPYGSLRVDRLAPPAAPPGPPWLADWLKEQEGRAIVYATLGTVFSGNLRVLRAMLDGLAGDEAAVLLTVGPAGDPGALGALPPRVRVERFVPQDAVLPACAAVVSHGGSGTTLGALAHGLPHVMLPQGADQYLNAKRCEAVGLARGLLPKAVTPDAVRAALHELLDDPTRVERAKKVQAEMAGALTPDDAIALIQQAL
jgi:hypothetical protein